MVGLETLPPDPRVVVRPGLPHLVDEPHVPEGADKPYKYPSMFRGADVLLLNKMDLVAYQDFDVDYFRHGVEVLNINELANSLKPSVLPGETMRVFILKEGKEYNQGVAYLDDGTMVVIEQGRRFIGQPLDVVVTSVLQTTAGRMIFTRTREEAPVAHDG